MTSRFCESLGLCAEASLIRRSVFAVVAVAFLFAAALGCASKKPPTPTDLGGQFVSYEKSIQPIFNRRCAVCHSCNDAPCQLDATAFAGIDRGASSDNVYADRLFSTDPSRLFIDAKSTKEWRDRGFFSVIRHHPPGDARNLDESILYQLLEYRQKNGLPEKARFDAFRSRRCPNLRSTLPWLRTEIASLFETGTGSDLGMPFGFPALSKQEFLAIRDWLARGAPGPVKTDPSDRPRFLEEASAVQSWEAFLNGASPRVKLVSRYIYEHLFLAHLYFGPVSASERPQFYRLVRSTTPAPQPIDEIARRLPYDNPGEKFFYRFRPIESVIVHKTHLNFELSAETLSRWEKSFLSPDWTVEEKKLPSYFANDAANPFTTFAAIPAAARYQFMLDNAEYFVSSFMKGPVCRGQLALNVIDDQFLMFFLDPKADQSIVDPEFLKSLGKYLITPFRPEDLMARSSEDDWSIFQLPIRAVRQIRLGFYPYYKGRQLKFLKKEDEFYQRARPAGFSLEDIWDGDSNNLNAVLTVFRHYDSASVIKGAWGGMPKTALVLDYPIFERMYYNLVASFDIYGDVKSQLATRLYFDDLRIEAENLFLSFLPLEVRTSVRNFWYRDAESEINSDDYPFYGTTAGTPRGTQIPYESNRPKNELIARLLFDRIRFHAGAEADTLNSGQVSDGTPPVPEDIHSLADLRIALGAFGGRGGDYVRELPDLSLVRFRKIDHGKDAVFTFIRNRAHRNVKYLFDEDSRLAEGEDTLSIMEEFHGSYPNFFFDVREGHAGEFLSRLLKLGGKKSKFKDFVDDFGVRRRDEHFWEQSDFFNDRLVNEKPVEGGLLDLNRYANF